mmetsp:Transcript_11227/g.69336  ORF Transcript_11227/g.69336 Transcript_11227/m.69336 type:complete len:386 (-) Transcript_11227:2198-3355(-)
MTDHAVPFHLSKSKPAVTRSTLNRLPGKNLNGTTTTRVNFVVYHMFQALVVRGAHEDLGVQPATSVSIVHHFVSTRLKTMTMELRRYVIDCHVCERRGVPFFPFKHSHLAHEALHQLTDGHARGDRMRIDNDIRCDPFCGEWHVLLRVRHADGTLLTVPAGKLVADLRDAYGPNPHFHKTQALIIGSDQNLVNDSGVTPFHGSAQVSLRVPLAHAWYVVRHGNSLPDDDVFPRDACTWRDQPILIQLVVRPHTHPQRVFPGRTFQLFTNHSAHLLLLFIAICFVGRRAKQTSVNGGLVHDQGVFLVVPSVNGNGNTNILACRKIPEVQVLHGLRNDQGLLWVEKHVTQGVEAQIVICDIDAHGLLAHGRLVRITWGLVVIWEGDD